MTIILAMMFGATVGFSVAIGFNYNSYNRGHKEGFHEGRDLGYEMGHKEGFEEACRKVVLFPNKEESL